MLFLLTLEASHPFQFICLQPVYDTKKVIAILTYNQMPETDELRYDFQFLPAQRTA